MTITDQPNPTDLPQGRACARLGLALAAGLVLVPPGPDEARAEIIENPVAVFAALDKVTARISPLSIPIGNTVKFGALKITP
ncbi:MAG: hypothetical protein AB7G34_08000, partial [Hyphomicrobiales bacterium]